MLAFNKKVIATAIAVAVVISGTHLLRAQEDPSRPVEAKVEKRPATKFIRVERHDDGEPKTLQTSIVRYVPASGEGDLVVDLVGVVHIGDKGYYEDLNEKFKAYDVVLYELVAPKDKAIPKRDRGENPISFMQGMTKSMLDLESQVEHIDYTKDNFVHADMSPDEMAEAMQKRGEDGLTLALSVMADVLRQANVAQQKAEEEGAAPEALDPFALLLDPQRSLKMKRMMAENFAAADDVEGGLGPTLHRMLIDDRNAAAMKVFQKELAKGRKKIAIFYGAAHMPDFEKRLIVDFELKPAETTWLTAWRMKSSNMGGGAEDPLQGLFKLLEEAAKQP